jgi:hypothetical protein
MADVGLTTGAPACAPIPVASEQPDPVVLLIDTWERQVAAWRALPPEADELRNPVADMSWGETGTLLRQFRPTTVGGALQALRHALKCLHRYHPEACSDFCVPLAENAVATLECLTAA